MSIFLSPRVKETSTTTGTGTFTLAGAVSGYRTFATAFGNSATCYYMITDGTNWEYGRGTTGSGASPNLLSRGLVFESTNGGSLVNFGAGTKNVYNLMPPESCVNNGIVQTFANGDTTPDIRGGVVFLSSAASGTSITFFDGGAPGDEIEIIFQNSNTTIVQGANMKLLGGANFNGTANDALRLVRDTASWYEVWRGANS